MNHHPQRPEHALAFAFLTLSLLLVTSCTATPQPGDDGAQGEDGAKQPATDQVPADALPMQQDAQATEVQQPTAVYAFLTSNDECEDTDIFKAPALQKQYASWHTITTASHQTINYARYHMLYKNDNAYPLYLSKERSDQADIIQVVSTTGGVLSSRAQHAEQVLGASQDTWIEGIITLDRNPAHGPKYELKYKPEVSCSSGNARVLSLSATIPIEGNTQVDVGDPRGGLGHILMAPCCPGPGHGRQPLAASVGLHWAPPPPNPPPTTMTPAVPLTAILPTSKCHSNTSHTGADRWALVPTVPLTTQQNLISSALMGGPNPRPASNGEYTFDGPDGCMYVKVDAASIPGSSTTPIQINSPLVGVYSNFSAAGSTKEEITDLHLCVTYQADSTTGAVTGPTIEWKECPSYTPTAPAINACWQVYGLPQPESPGGPAGTSYTIKGEVTFGSPVNAPGARLLECVVNELGYPLPVPRATVALNNLVPPSYEFDAVRPAGFYQVEILSGGTAVPAPPPPEWNPSKPITLSGPSHTETINFTFP